MVHPNEITVARLTLTSRRGDAACQLRDAGRVPVKPDGSEERHTATLHEPRVDKLWTPADT